MEMAVVAVVEGVGMTLDKKTKYTAQQSEQSEQSETEYEMGPSK
ncbi:hypothetical protein PC116_g34529 [Phytophthora cactorum]|nr:hypothetical protein PC116_g34529 [Phytophthora cactorum]